MKILLGDFQHHVIREAEAPDGWKVVDSMFIKTSTPEWGAGLTPMNYCFAVERRAELQTILDALVAEKKRHDEEIHRLHALATKICAGR